MSWFLLALIVCAAATAGAVIWYKKSYDADFGPIMLGTIAGVLGIAFLALTIGQPIDLRMENSRQLKERAQIVHQIENLNDEKDKVKLNEWILTYNDWVNDVNTSKEMFGWFSWYHTLDMSEHTILELQ